jgi:transcriptional regulator with XRE-family HTH domain
MPSHAPAVGDRVASELNALGERIRACRRQQKVSATAAAEAAGLSRVTLHRIERGEPSVTMGAWLSAIDAVGLRLSLGERVAPGAGALAGPSVDTARAGLPEVVRLADFPQLRRLAWPLPGVEALTPTDALQLYERNWRHVDVASLEPGERRLIQALADQFARGRLLV